jgi:hypothetical protein
MPIFYVETVATSPIREYWKVEAANAEEAAEVYGERGECLYDEVLGEEEGRTVDTVHPEAALASFFARQSLAAEAPAMLAALRDTLRDLDAVTGVDDHGSDTIGCMENRIRAILSRIDGPTAQPAGAIGEAGAGQAFTVIWGNIGDDSGKRLDHVTVERADFDCIMDAAFACFFTDMESSGWSLSEGDREEYRHNTAFDGYAILPGHVTDAPGLGF